MNRAKVSKIGPQCPPQPRGIPPPHPAEAIVQ